MSTDQDLDINRVVEYVRSLTAPNQDGRKFLFLRDRIRDIDDLASGTWLGMTIGRIMNDNPWINGLTISFKHENNYDEPEYFRTSICNEQEGDFHPEPDEFPDAMDEYRTRSSLIDIDCTEPSYQEMLNKADGESPEQWLAEQFHDGDYSGLEDDANVIFKLLDRNPFVSASKVRKLRVDRSCIAHLLDDTQANAELIFETLAPRVYDNIIASLGNQWNDETQRPQKPKA